MTGFWAQLCAENTMIRIQQEVNQYSRNHQLRCIVGLDFQKAFDTVHHSAILGQLQRLTPSSQMYNYIHDFLTTATLYSYPPTANPTGHHLTESPQGSALTPFLFNLALRAIPLLLERFHSLSFGLYADDVTPWTSTCNPGTFSSTPQGGMNIIVYFCRQVGLTISLTKSEFLAATNHPHRSCAQAERDLIQLTLRYTPLSHQRTIKVLGIHLTKKIKATSWLHIYERELT